jgi:Na+-translocating ferredoxin:NAD+ oxidoreductase RnfG subunit
LFPGATPERATSASGEYYLVLDDARAVVGYGLTATHYGFNGEITTLLGVSAAGVTVGLETISQRESWWSFIPESWFLEFIGIPTAEVTLLPGYDQNCYRCAALYEAIGVDAVSGATYTSDALIKDAMDGYLHWDEVVSGQ